MNNKKTLLLQLKALGLSKDEGKIYLELLKEQHSHLELARITGVNRTKVYRIVDDLHKKSLVTRQTDDRGTFLIATDPTTLEISLTNREEKLKAQRDTFMSLLPDLTKIKEINAESNKGFFEVNTYEGVEGLKQMLWHELKAKDEVLVFGSGTLDRLVDSRKWAERHRAMTVRAGYKVRELINPGKKPGDFTSLESFREIFSKKYIDEKKLLLEQQIAIYNNTVSVYNWRQDEKVGYEVINKPYATMWRQLFEHYWCIAE